MAESVIKAGAVRIPVAKTATLTAGNTNANKVDFSSEIAANTPTGKTFKRLEFIGSWPGATWNNAVVVRNYRASVEGEKFLELVTLQTQSYAVRAVAVYE